MCRAPEKSRLVSLDWKDAGHVDVNAEQFGSRIQPILFGDEPRPNRRLAPRIRVPEALISTTQARAMWQHPIRCWSVCPEYP